MSVDPNRIRRSFSRGYDSYHDSATPQLMVARGLVRRLMRLGGPKRIGTLFEFGCGTGHLTDVLASHVHWDRAVLNDLVGQAKTTADAHGAGFIPGDVMRVDWPNAPELIASASTMQWVDEPGALVSRAARELAPGGWLALAGYGRQQFQELADLGAGEGAPGLCDPGELLNYTNGLNVFEARDRICRIWFDDPMQVLRHLRETGVNATSHTPWTRARLREFCDQYTARFGRDGKVPLTWHPVWLIASKPG